MPLILEGLLTTLGPEATVNVAPMGPIVDAAMERLTLRPFHTSQSLANLRRTRQGVFHVTDDVLLLARACIGPLATMPAWRPADVIAGAILTDACRYFELQVETMDESQARATIVARVVAQGELRPFFGFNRAKHAVLEGAILASRVGILPQNEILKQLPPLATIVHKTGGPAEREALQLLENYIRGGGHVESG